MLNSAWSCCKLLTFTMLFQDHTWYFVLGAKPKLGSGMAFIVG